MLRGYDNCVRAKWVNGDGCFARALAHLHSKAIADKLDDLLNISH